MFILTIEPKSKETEVKSLDINNMSVEELVNEYPELKDTVHSQLVELKGTYKSKQAFIKSANLKDNRKRSFFFKDIDEMVSYYFELKDDLEERFENNRIVDEYTGNIFDYYKSLKDEIEFYLHNEWNIDVDFDEVF